jgi:2'-5' RNA ligase
MNKPEPLLRRAETALIIAMPETPAVMQEIRIRHDPSARLGVPAHITIMYPFVEADLLDQDLHNRLEAVTATVPAFDFRLSEVRWFGDEMVWLAPEPAEPFRRLTTLVQDEFGTSPYGAAYDDVTPHLTLADHAAPEYMRGAEATASSLLPFRSRATEVLLLEGGPTGWTEVRRLRLD